MSKSQSELSETGVNLLLDGVNLQSLSSEVSEDLLVSEPNIELFKIDGHSSLGSDPISHFSDGLFFGSVQGDGGDIVLGSLPDVLISDDSESLNIERLEQP